MADLEGRYAAQLAAQQAANQKLVDAGLGVFTHGGFAFGGNSNYVPLTPEAIQARNEAMYWGVDLLGTEQGSRDDRYRDPITDAAVLNQRLADAKAKADMLTARYANAGKGRWNAMTADDLKGANDWARQNIINSVAQLGGIADPKYAYKDVGDNYKGWKANSNTNDIFATQPSWGFSTPDRWQRQEAIDKARAAFNADSEKYINDRLAKIKDWTVGGDNNQQYVFNPKTGQLMNVWTHNTDESYLAVPLLVAGLGAAGVLGGLGGAAAGAEALTPAAIESAVGTAGYGASAAADALVGAGVSGAGAYGLADAGSGLLTSVPGAGTDVLSQMPWLDPAGGGVTAGLANGAAAEAGLSTAAAAGAASGVEPSWLDKLKDIYNTGKSTVDSVKAATKPYTDAYSALKTLTGGGAKPGGGAGGTGTGGTGNGTDMSALLAMLAAGQQPQAAPIQTPLTEIKSYVDPFGKMDEGAVKANTGGSLDDLVRYLRS